MKFYTRVFKNDESLKLMLYLRQNGWTYQSLALIFGADHSSIYHACKKHNIARPEWTVSLSLPDIVGDLRALMPKVKSYRDYVNETKKYRFPKLYSTLYKYNEL